jgi:cobalt/nickel transport protein
MRRFWIVFAAVIVVIAGGVSYLASASPDGLDSATLRGCDVIEVDGAEELTGSCIAQHATDHALASSPLADYAVMGNGASAGVAGVLGAAVVLVIAFGAFRLIARSGRSGS